MLLQNPLVFALAASTLVGDGAAGGHQMMDSGADDPCEDMQGMDHMGGGMMGSRNDMMAHHEEMTADMDEMHAQCHEMMESHHRGNATAGQRP